jgi:hypothetical protein
VRYGTDHSEAWDSQEVSARDLTMEHLCRISWGWGYARIAVTTTNETANSLRFRYIMGEMDEEIRTLTLTHGQQQLKRIHRLLLIKDVEVRVTADWRWIWATSTWEQLVQRAWNYHTLVMHLWLNPHGDDCSCWKS